MRWEWNARKVALFIDRLSILNQTEEQRKQRSACDLDDADFDAMLDNLEFDGYKSKLPFNVKTARVTPRVKKGP